MSAISLFDFDKDYILEDSRVLLRPLVLEDLNFLTPFVQEAPFIWQYSLVAINTIADLSDYITNAVQSRKDKTAYPFIVFDKSINAYVGCTRYYDIQLQHQSTQLGYTWYGSATWGTGVNTHCKWLLLQFAFDQMHWERVEFRADNENKRSIAAMQKIGATVEGVLRSHMLKPNGKRRDSIVLSILKADWQIHLKDNLLAKL